MTRNFHAWFNTFRNSIADYHYYTDFPKVYRNIDDLRVELNILNSLIGSQHIQADFEHLVTKYPETLKCIPLLLAIRSQEISATDTNGSFIYNFRQTNYPLSQYAYFMQETGLFDLISNHLINNLIDYATGVEVGLDSNGRKNRGGHLMENLVETYLQNSHLTYYKEMNLSDIEKRWSINLSLISNQGKTEKRFDFVVKTPTMIYGIETNFYGSSGSKLNETARSYKTLALESSQIPGFTFVWFTDGNGWQNARHNLEETFDVLPHLYNISDLERGIVEEVFQ